MESIAQGSDTPFEISILEVIYERLKFGVEVFFKERS